MCPIVLDITIPYCQCVHFSDPDRFRNTAGAPLTAERTFETVSQLGQVVSFILVTTLDL